MSKQKKADRPKALEGLSDEELIERLLIGALRSKPAMRNIARMFRREFLIEALDVEIG
jgi:hypothetical protein